MSQDNRSSAHLCVLPRAFILKGFAFPCPPFIQGGLYPHLPVHPNNAACSFIRSSKLDCVHVRSFIQRGLRPFFLVHPHCVLFLAVSFIPAILYSSTFRSSRARCVLELPFIRASLRPGRTVHPFVYVPSSLRSSGENLKARCQQRHLLYERLLTPCLQAFPCPVIR